ncbi:hypothetical protein VM1G_04622 [Cytospora mali]|uniref:Uncharacterized protein n=1 Tax=Cytospora mali TaxID=578113 RepID=A0A194VWU9_CYTMA|nr:hypothetical protein VM1G_04622 [Valsa mali]
MQALQAVLLSTLVSLALATNTTVRYFSTKEGCVGNYFQCSNIPIGYCCQASSPWCIYVDCPDCISHGVTAYSLLTHANGECSGDPIQPTCASTSQNNICCSVDYNYQPDLCSTMVTPNIGNKLEKEECLGVVQPDTLVYTDSNGVTNDFHLPNGTFERAVQFANVSGWDGLADFLGQANS